MPDDDNNASQPALDQLAEEPARLPHGGCADMGAVPVEDVPGDDDPRPIGDRDVHQPDRLLGSGPSWTGYAGDRYRSIRSVCTHRAADHLPGGLGTHRAVVQQGHVGDTENGFLGIVAVGHRAAHEDR